MSIKEDIKHIEYEEKFVYGELVIYGDEGDFNNEYELTEKCARDDLEEFFWDTQNHTIDEIDEMMKNIVIKKVWIEKRREL